MWATLRVAPVALALCAASACGGGGGGGTSTPTAPTGPSAPSGLQITRQQVTLTSNIVHLSWTGSATTYRVSFGTTSGASDIFTADVTGTSYTWMAPRVANAYYGRVVATSGTQTSGPSNETLVFTIDLRNVIEALFFRTGPMSDAPSAVPGNTSAGVWPDGTRLYVPIEQQLGEPTRVFAERFLNDYAAIGSGAITATTSLTPESFTSLTLGQVPLFTIPTRVRNDFCSSGALACAYYGPAPVGSNRSLVTMVSASQGALRAMAHELGHAYGMGHVRVTAAVRAELNFMMNPTLVSDEMTETEKAAIAAAREGGIRAGWTRSQAVAAGLVNAYTGPVTGAAAALYDTGARANDKCRIIGG